MLKILSAAQIKALDKATIESEPVSSIDLMERASLAFVRWFTRNFSSSKKIGVVCGTGNNGGDGLAIARMLRERHYDVSVWIVMGGSIESPDFKTNLARLAGITPTMISTAPESDLFKNVHVLVDAMFGSGLSRPLDGVYAAAAEAMNNAPAVKVAVDIPSGLMCDSHSSGPIIKASYTISFQIPKMAFLLPENEEHVGNWEIVDIGLSKEHILHSETSNFVITREWVRERLPARKKFSHKGDFGKALVVAGSFGKMGAAVLCARATMRVGAGLLTVRVPACGHDIIQTTVPEAMASIDDVQSHLTFVPAMDAFDCVGIGPGIGTHQDTAAVVGTVLRTGKPAVVDADALNLIAANPPLRKLLHKQTILTPHPGEFRRLVGDWSDDFERLQLQKKLSAETGAVVVLKGAHTTVVTPGGKTYFNNTGNPGMATGGSGDVLTGMLTGLLAQGCDVEAAALIGVHLHGLAADLALPESGLYPLIASDIVDRIPRAFQSLFL